MSTTLASFRACFLLAAGLAGCSASDQGIGARPDRPRAASSASAISVVTHHYDNARLGQNVNETVLTPGNVNAATFGKLFSQAVDGAVYAQPLVLPGVAIAGKGTHDAVFIATQHDSVYAFDANDNLGPNASPLWQVSLLAPEHGAGPGATTVPPADVASDDIKVEIGITSTPVLDPGTGTLYVVAKSKEGTAANPAYPHRLHALDIASGAERPGSPVLLQASVPGTGDDSQAGMVSFNRQQLPAP